MKRLLLGTIVLLMLVPNVEAVSLKWDTYIWPTDATGRSFTIEKSTDLVTWGVYVANVASTATTYTDTAPVGDICFRIVAKASNKGTSVPSNIACPQLSAPTGLVITAP